MSPGTDWQDRIGLCRTSNSSARQTPSPPRLDPLTASDFSCLFYPCGGGVVLFLLRMPAVADDWGRTEEWVLKIWLGVNLSEYMFASFERLSLLNNILLLLLFFF